MITRLIAILASITLFACNLMGQEIVWSLEQCIDHAKQHNLQVKTATYDLYDALLTKKEAVFQRLPSLNAGIGGGFQFGRTIDPTTNGYNNQKIGYNTYSVNAALPIYTGNRLRYTIDKTKIDSKIAKLEIAIATNEITLSIVKAYLEVLLSEEHLANVQKRVEQSKAQQALVDKQIQLGVVRKNAKLEFSALVLKDEKDLVAATNQRTLNYLNLKQLLELDATTSLRIVPPKNILSKITSKLPVSTTTLLKEALEIQPQITVNELRLKSAEKNIAIARTGYLPTISLFGTLSTNTSSEGKKVESLETIQVAQQGMINGSPVLLELEQTIPNLMNSTYGEQIKDNFGQGVGVNINIPIYNKHQNKIAVEKVKVNLLKTRTMVQQQKQQLKMEVLKAHADLQAAEKTYEAAEKSLAATQLAFEDTNDRFKLGMASTYELTISNSDLDIAQFDLSQAKYRYLLYQKVVDFYRGTPISMDN